MKNRHTAIGMDTTGAPFTSRVHPSSVCANCGATRPSAMPATMHSATHTLR